ncbi:sensor histidine kinase [Streptomyces sp. A012304]|uniref:sensor histidine kinase n=1 Tax=Streptomyces sp. A012304 TaxID=375446 RepID=UPI0022301D51|nr:sensor histidine kinase [Streptomyces sp. A012304]GKQ38934.1 two-component sensor histidine kinase [Streptomyces sp. A012304]
MSTNLERYQDRVERYADRHPFVIDAGYVLALMGCAALGVTLTLPGASPPDHDRSVTCLMGLACLALLKHRTHPRATVVVNAVCVVAAVGMGYLITPLLLAPVMAALYWLATESDRRTNRLFGGITTLGVIIAAAISDSMDHLSLLLKTMGPLFWLMLPLAAGTMTRMRRAYLQAVQARAEHAERTREEEARLRVTEERVRIARELHDVVAHHLALANAQAGTAAHLAATRPEQARKILDDLAGTTSSALRELKATVGLLREPDDPDAASLEPSPGLARLPELVSSCESAGLKVTVTTEGAARPLSPGVDLTAYRIVQEALTNATKHASARAAHIHLAYSTTRLAITVTDDGTAPAAPAAPSDEAVRGFGLMGMRERAQSVGGNLCAGHRPEGGFEVSTALPLHPLTPQPAEAPTP